MKIGGLTEIAHPKQNPKYRFKFGPVMILGFVRGEPKVCGARCTAGITESFSKLRFFVTWKYLTKLTFNISLIRITVLHAFEQLAANPNTIRDHISMDV